jgi:hypothetical protein
METFLRKYGNGSNVRETAGDSTGLVDAGGAG